MKWRSLTEYEKESSSLPMGDEAEFLQEIVELIMPPAASLEAEIDTAGAQYAVDRFDQIAADEINFAVENRRNLHMRNLDRVYAEHPWLRFYQSDAEKEDHLTKREAQSWGLYLYYQQLAYIVRDELEALCSH